MIVQIIIFSVFILWVLGLLCTVILQDLFFLRPEKLNVDFDYNFEFPFREIWINTREGAKLNGLWFYHSKPKGIVVYFHGNSSNISRWANLHFNFTKLGYDFFIYDYRGFGKSVGKRTEKTFYEDATRVYDFLANYYESEKIILYGRSLGCAMASYLAAEKKARHLILETPFYDVPSLFYAYFPLLPRIMLFKYKFRNHKHIDICSFPISIFHGTRDAIVPIKNAIKLREHLSEKDRFVKIEGGRHNDLSFFESYNRRVLSILK